MFGRSVDGLIDAKRVGGDPALVKALMDGTVEAFQAHGNHGTAAEIAAGSRLQKSGLSGQLHAFHESLAKTGAVERTVAVAPGCRVSSPRSRA